MEERCQEKGRDLPHCGLWGIIRADGVIGEDRNKDVKTTSIYKIKRNSSSWT
jgi:hypothetical protein